VKKYFSLLIFPSIALFILFVAIQCKPAADGKAADAETAPDTTAIIEPEITSIQDTTTAPEATIETATKTETTSAAEPVAKTKPTTTVEQPIEKTESKPTPEPLAKAEEKVVAPAPEPKADKETKTPPPAAAPVTASFSVKSAKGVIEGTSNLHAWKMDITKMECKGSFQSLDNTIKAVKNVEVKILVENLKSEKGKTMDQKTYDAFNSSKNPYIIFTFSSADVRTDDAGGVTIAASGSLNMAGTSKTIPITAKGKVLANGDLQLSVSKKMKMTEFNMDPPTALMGTIKVGDEVNVAFDLVLAQ
jgi:hypothetical protein